MPLLMPLMPPMPAHVAPAGCAPPGCRRFVNPQLYPTPTACIRGIMQQQVGIDMYCCGPSGRELGLGGAWVPPDTVPHVCPAGMGSCSMLCMGIAGTAASSIAMTLRDCFCSTWHALPMHGACSCPCRIPPCWSCLAPSAIHRACEASSKAGERSGHDKVCACMSPCIMCCLDEWTCLGHIASGSHKLAPVACRRSPTPPAPSLPLNHVQDP